MERYFLRGLSRVYRDVLTNVAEYTQMIAVTKSIVTKNKKTQENVDASQLTNWFTKPRKSKVENLNHTSFERWLPP